MNRPTSEVVRELNASLHASGWLDRQLTTKLCCRCGETKPLTDFTPNKKNTGIHGKGRATTCRSCEAARKRAERSR